MAKTPPKPQFVRNDRDLDEFLDVIEESASLAVDTEANSMHAYRGRLCLIQVSAEGRDWVIDPLQRLDLDPFFAILEDPDVEKIFHDAEFDVLLLRRAHDVRLRGLFDTKVVATAVGVAQYGLAALVEEHFGVSLDKSQQRSDWGRRPLDPKQVRYAAEDTRYLHELRDILDARLELRPEIVRLEVAAEFRRLERLVPKDDEADPEGWAKLKGAHRLQPVELVALRELWRWREREAAKRDVPPFKVIGNTQLLALASSRPSDVAGMQRIHGVSARLVEKYGSKMLKLLDEAREQPGIERPAGPTRTSTQRREDSEDADVLERLKRWRKRASEERGTDPSLVMHREVLERLSRLRPRPTTLEELEATGDFEDWRLEANGPAILDALVADAAGTATKRGKKNRASKKRRR